MVVLKQMAQVFVCYPVHCAGHKVNVEVIHITHGCSIIGVAKKDFLHAHRTVGSDKGRLVIEVHRDKSLMPPHVALEILLEIFAVEEPDSIIA